MPKLIHLRSKITKEFRFLARGSENAQLYLDVMNSAPVEFGSQIGCQLPPNMQLVRFERLSAAADVGEQIFELALVDHYAKMVVYYNKVIVLLHDPVLGAKPVTQLLVWRTPDPAYKSVISGVADRVFTDYLLEHYQIIMSDSQQTGQGQFFWERQILVALGRQLYVYYYHLMNAKLQHIADRETFEQLQDVIWGDTDDHVQHLAIISKSPLPSGITVEIVEE
ncbi:hypothetical protein [Aeromonas jandaei]|uniref:hypothetical protein n=1 Tax=Aeromonas jandaei TaxID=650 RepID=UPI003B9F1702